MARRLSGSGRAAGRDLRARGRLQHLSGFGVFTAASIPAPWACCGSAGASSLVDDVRFLGGHGSGTNPYNNNHTADPDLRKRWDGQYPSLWVTHGGGGTFADIWTPDTFRAGGILCLRHQDPRPCLRAFQRTPCPQRDQVRSRGELGHQRAADRGGGRRESRIAVAGIRLVEEHHHRQLSRLSRHALPRAFPAAVRLYHSSNIHFRNVHVNAESGYATCDENGCGTFLRVSKFPYENAIEDVTHHLEVREREFAVLDIPAIRPARACRCLRSAGAGSKGKSWKTDSFPSPAQPWMLPASSISSIAISSASMAGRRPRGSPSSAIIRWIP
jgi:hypothetical protein